MKQQHIANNVVTDTSNGITYLAYLQLLLSMLDKHPGQFLCNINNKAFQSTGELTHSQQFQAAINVELKGCVFITSPVFLANNGIKLPIEAQAEYRRYILMRMIGTEKLRERQHG